MLRNPIKRSLHTVINDSSKGAIPQSWKDLPTNTGAGLFIEYPKFEPLGTPPTLLHVALPPSTVLNCRSRSLVAANGSLEKLSSKLSVLNLWKGKPLLYNEITSTSPLSLILSDKNGFLHLPLTENQTWNVLNTDHITGWYGTLQINSQIHGVQVTCQSRGDLILNGSRQIFTLELTNDEQLFVNPSSIVAYQSENATSFHKLKLLDFPKFGLWNTITLNAQKLYERLVPKQELTTTNVTAESKPEDAKLVEVHKPNVFDRFKQRISMELVSLFLKNRLLYEIKGPAKVIVQNDFQTNYSDTFTKDQLSKIYQDIK